MAPESSGAPLFKLELNQDDPPRSLVESCSTPLSRSDMECCLLEAALVTGKSTAPPKLEGKKASAAAGPLLLPPLPPPPPPSPSKFNKRSSSVDGMCSPACAGEAGDAGDGGECGDPGTMVSPASLPALVRRVRKAVRSGGGLLPASGSGGEVVPARGAPGGRGLRICKAAAAAAATGVADDAASGTCGTAPMPAAPAPALGVGAEAPGAAAPLPLADAAKFAASTAIAAMYLFDVGCACCVESEGAEAFEEGRRGR